MGQDRHQLSQRQPWLVRVRLWIAQRLFRGAQGLVFDDPIWREPLTASVAPRPGDKVIEVSGSRAGVSTLLAERNPHARFVIVRSGEQAQPITQHTPVEAEPRNVDIVHIKEGDRLPFEALTFDKVVSVLTFHRMPMERKVTFAAEMLRVLRRGGTLNVADLDVPSTPREGAILKAAGAEFGSDSIQPHRDGAWVDALTKAGFKRVRRVSSHSIITGRVTVVVARRQ
jgi:ubiquinone/menaquinone biosynthesis C-methylase UbiE